MIRSLVASADAVFDDDFTPGRNFSMERLEEALANGDMLWIDIVNSEEKEVRWLEGQLGLHPTVTQDLLREDRRPSLMLYSKYIFISLFQPNLRLNKVESQEVHCLIGKNYLVTVRNPEAKAIDEAYNRAANSVGPWRLGIGHFLYLTIQQVVDSYYPLVDRISLQLNQIEESLLANGNNKEARKPIYMIKGQLIGLRQMVAPQREVLSNAIGEELVANSAEMRDLFRHLYERLLRVYDVIDSQRDLSNSLIDFIDSRETNKLGETVSRLTILSMIFLPLTFLASLFELNFATTEDPIILPIRGAVMFSIVLFSMVLSVALLALMFRKRGWI